MRINVLYIFFVLLAVLVAYADYFPHGLDDRFKEVELLSNNYKGLVNGVVDKSLGGPYIYRLFVPYVTYYLHDFFHWKMLSIGFYLNILFSSLSFSFMFLLVKKLMNPLYGLVGVLMLACYLFFTQAQFSGITGVETQDVVNVFVMLAALYYMLQQKYGWSMLMIALGVLNRETPLFLLVPFLFYTLKEKHYLKAVLGVALTVGTYLLIRLLIHDPNPKGDWMLFETLEKNIPYLNKNYHDFAVDANIVVFFYLAPLLLFFFKKKKERNKYFLPIKIMLVLFVVTHYYVGLVHEIRLFLPVAAILIPFVMFEVGDRLTGINS